MAAEALGRARFTTAELVEELAWPDSGVEVGLVESAGGVRSPLTHDGDTVAFVRALSPDLVLLVADAGLGTINAVRMSMDALAVAPHCTVVLNRFDGADDLHVRNRRWLTERDALQVVTMPGEETAVTALVRGWRRDAEAEEPGAGARHRRHRTGLPRDHRLPPVAQSTVRAPNYYVSMGDSYSVGYQPGSGHGGYTAYVAHRSHLTLVNFGCAGATTTSILVTIGCPLTLPHTAGAISYTATTQAAAAEAFIVAHRGHIGVITVSSVGMT